MQSNETRRFWSIQMAFWKTCSKLCDCDCQVVDSYFFCLFATTLSVIAFSFGSNPTVRKKCWCCCEFCIFIKNKKQRVHGQRCVCILAKCNKLNGIEKKWLRKNSSRWQWTKTNQTDSVTVSVGVNVRYWCTFSRTLFHGKMLLEHLVRASRWLKCWHVIHKSFV